MKMLKTARVQIVTSDFLVDSRNRTSNLSVHVFKVQFPLDNNTYVTYNWFYTFFLFLYLHHIIDL